MVWNKYIVNIINEFLVDGVVVLKPVSPGSDENTNYQTQEDQVWSRVWRLV